jgi:PKD domain
MRPQTTPIPFATAGRAYRRRLTASLAATLVLGTLLGCAGQARAVILPATTIDGPSSEIVDFGGAAMAEDGTGGLVYLKRVNGVAHVFVSRYLGGHWLAPIRVDTEQPYAASWPVIGAANGGELVVVWATPFASEDGHPIYELVSAMLGPGGSTFGPAMIVDRDIRAGTGTSPDLAMSSTGYAYLVYRVVTETNANSATLLRPGDVDEQVRVARYDGERWTALGAINRDLHASMRPPTSANAPQVAIGPTGNGVVVWQEPEVGAADGVARIWARRLFGTSIDYVMPVSATAYNGAPIDEDAEAPSVAFSRLGQAEVAYRQNAGPGSPLPGPRIFINTLPDGEASSGAEFQGPVIADAAVPGGKAAAIGRPCIDIDEKRSMRMLYDDNGAPRVIEGSDLGHLSTLSLGPPFVGSELAPSNELSCASVMDPEGGGVSAWPSADPQGHPAVAVRQDFPDGGVQTALVGGGAGGAIGGLAVGRSGLGDAIVAFQQGPLGDAAIVAAQVSAPPSTFVVNVPKVWIKPAQARISWLPAQSADEPVTYTVVLDGHALPTPAGTFAMTISPRWLSSGHHRVQLLATDSYGEATLTPASTLLIDGVPPAVKISVIGGGQVARVRVSDAYSGVSSKAVQVSFGDGHKAGGRALLTHRYAHAGIYTVTVRVRDNLGNEGVVRRLVSVR